MPAHFPPLRALIFHVDHVLGRSAKQKRPNPYLHYPTGTPKSRPLQQLGEKKHLNVKAISSQQLSLTSLSLPPQEQFQPKERLMDSAIELKPNHRLSQVLLHLRRFFRLAVMTNCPNTWTELMQCNVSDFFDEVTNLSPARLGRSAVQHYQRLAKSLGIQSNECLVMRDHLALDFDSIQQSGMYTLLIQHIQNIYTLPDIVAPAFADYYSTHTSAQARCAIQVATQALKAGQMVILPTDTVYGLATRPHPQSIRWLYRAKGRLPDQPLVLLLSHPSAAGQYVRVNPLAKSLIDKYWPGPLTLVLPVQPSTPWGQLTRGGRQIGIRVPDHSLCQSIIRQAGGVLVVTSANCSGLAAPREPKEVDKQILAFAKVLVNAGKIQPGVPSTIIKVIGNKQEVLRPGCLQLVE